jgi:hypothetical protein
MNNVALGNEQAIEGYRKPLERDLHTHETLTARAKEIGVSMKLEPAKGEEGADAPVDLLAARIADFVYRRPAPGKRVLQIGPTFDATGGARDDLAFRSIVDPGGIWATHAEHGSKPTWVESDSEELAKMISKYYGCPIGRPADWVETFTA